MKTNNNLQKIKEIELSISQNLFIVCAIVTLATMTLIVVDFFSRGRFMPAKINLFYLSVVVIYSFHKELTRWLGEKKARRQGEYFVYAWVILTTALYIVNFFTHEYFSYSVEGYPLGALRDISLLTMQVLGVFIVTRVLKLLFLFKK